MYIMTNNMYMYRHRCTYMFNIYETTVVLFNCMKKRRPHRTNQLRLAKEHHRWPVPL